ncbi:YciI family protein [Streptomyces sp. NPDC102360]|uniref:YciI family protein n=1 Tax=Streptomyces sp. NPDC102360 TaxID=3366160 RepID=UPI0038236824
MPVYAVTYTYTDDTAGRDTHRPAHKDFLNALADQGVNLCSGPFAAAEVPGALLLIRAGDKASALAATERDPFRVQGLVSGVEAREWTPVLGPLAARLG